MPKWKKITPKPKKAHASKPLPMKKRDPRESDLAKRPRVVPMHKRDENEGQLSIPFGPETVPSIGHNAPPKDDDNPQDRGC